MRFHHCEFEEAGNRRFLTTDLPHRGERAAAQGSAQLPAGALSQRAGRSRRQRARCHKRHRYARKHDDGRDASRGTRNPESKTKLADFNTHEDGLKALEDHRIDAYIADQVLLINLAKRARDPSSLEVGDRLITHEPYAIAMRRNDADFRLLADRALTDFYLSEDFLPLLETYFGSEAPMLHTQIIMQHVP